MWKILGISLLLAVGLVWLGGEAGAQSGVTRWLRYDVNLNIQQNSGLSVEEVHEVALVAGATTFERFFPTDKLDDINNMQVLEFGAGGQRQYQQADTQAAYTFQIESSAGQQTLRLYFPPNNAPTTRFVLRYFVVGGLQFYEEGDRFEWQPFGDGVAAPIASSTIAVNYPGAIPREQVVQASRGVLAEKFMSEGNRAVFRAANIAAGNTLEISLSYPHGIVQGNPPAWQRTAEFAQLLSWGSIIVALVLLVVGPIAALGWGFYKRRYLLGDLPKVPKHLKSPPSDRSPAMAGALLDGKARPRHLAALLLDLAAKGALNIYPGEKQGGSETTHEYNLYAVDPNRAIKAYETTVYGSIFGYVDAQQRELSAVRKSLFMAVPELENQINTEVAQSGFLADDVLATRRQYMAFGGAAALMSIVLGLLLGLIFSNLTYAVALPCLSVAVGAVAFVLVGFSLPKTTARGAEEIAGWRAFRRFINDLNVKTAEKNKLAFARLLPYAVAFGLEKNLVDKYAKAEVAMPDWWAVPAEKVPDLSDPAAHRWVGAAAASQPHRAKQRTKSAIRRLGGAAGGKSLKNNQPLFLAFLKATTEAFSKATLDEKIDFDSLADKQG